MQNQKKMPSKNIKFFPCSSWHKHITNACNILLGTLWCDENMNVIGVTTACRHVYKQECLTMMTMITNKSERKIYKPV